MLPISDVLAAVKVWIGLPVCAQHVGQDLETNRSVAGQSQQATTKAVELVERTTRHLEVGDDAAGVLVNKCAGTREMNASTDFLEERSRHRGRKRLDRMLDGWRAERQRRPRRA